MFLSRIFLQNFRNYSKSEFSFSPDLNLIIGPNMVGKTNLLEAICLLARAKSFRASREREMVGWEKEAAHLRGRTGEAVLEIALTRGEILGEKVVGKRLSLNGVVKRQIDFVGNLRVVYFGPWDLQLVTDSPSLRRSFLDEVLEQVDRDYRRANLVYSKALRSRNKLLFKKQEGAAVSPSEMLYWNNLLCENGPILTEKREEFIEFLNSTDSFGRKLVYDKSLMSPERLSQYSQEEVGAGVTLVGPQRDDFFFEFKDRNLATYGSRGEQRLAILWLKLGELEFIAQKGNLRPILLLDDIFSELDHKHRREVLEVIPKQQTIITTTDIHLVEKDYQEKAKMIELS